MAVPPAPMGDSGRGGVGSGNGKHGATSSAYGTRSSFRGGLPCVRPLHHLSAVQWQPRTSCTGTDVDRDFVVVISCVTGRGHSSVATQRRDGLGGVPSRPEVAAGIAPTGVVAEGSPEPARLMGRCHWLGARAGCLGDLRPPAQPRPRRSIGPPRHRLAAFAHRHTLRGLRGTIVRTPGTGPGELRACLLHGYRAARSGLRTESAPGPSPRRVLQLEGSRLAWSS
mmetsp:Transcript_97833/g.246807  ORF Transcript_97833/g.246807 Transcript_97833/m.246807 type:complete len:225 (-) Transcript_97833:34-708(-)